MEDDGSLIHGDVRKQFLPPEKKLERHLQTIKLSKPIVFCVRCGSTTVDQNFIDELRCYECGNTEKWNGRKFGIRRGDDDVGLSDVERALGIQAPF